jgi:hypothetical protein
MMDDVFSGIFSSPCVCAADACEQTLLMLPFNSKSETCLKLIHRKVSSSTTSSQKVFILIPRPSLSCLPPHQPMLLLFCSLLLLVRVLLFFSLTTICEAAEWNLTSGRLGNKEDH